MSWHPWPVDRSWPASSSEEVAFVAHLADASSGESVRHDRADVTVLVTALRNGAAAPEVLAWACGIRPGRLLAAYHDLERRRADAARAWRRIAAEPTTSTLATRGPDAARIVPAAVGQMTRVMRNTSAAGLPLAAAKLQARMDEAARTVAAVERQLAEERDFERACRVGAQLFAPFAECLWAHPLFLPERVGQLSPQRVADLLDEDPDHLGAVRLELEPM